MNNKNVSAIGIEEGINYLDKEFIAKLDENVDEILKSYSSFTEQGILSSANVDMLISEIKSKITTLQNDYDQLAQQIRTSMSQSSETITMNRSNIENTLN